MQLIMPLVVGAVLLCSGCSVISDDKHATYETRNEAEADGAVQRGWIPLFVPSSAEDIRESHNVDNNQQWLSFRFDNTDRAKIIQHMTAVPPEKIRFPESSASSTRTWWPQDLLAGHPPPVGKYNFYVYPLLTSGVDSASQNAYVALEAEAPHACYWSFGT